jgi:hypothetical protein
MTSNAEEQANPPAAATVQPPKAAKRAAVTPHKRRWRPASHDRDGKPPLPNGGPKAKGPPKA